MDLEVHEFHQDQACPEVLAFPYRHLFQDHLVVQEVQYFLALRLSLVDPEFKKYSSLVVKKQILNFSSKY